MQSNLHNILDVFSPFFNDRVLEQSFRTVCPSDLKFTKEDDAYVIKTLAAGVDIDNIDMEVSDNKLILKIEKENNEWSLSKREYKIALPKDVDLENINAELSKGILEVHIPRLIKTENVLKIKVKDKEAKLLDKKIDVEANVKE